MRWFTSFLVICACAGCHPEPRNATSPLKAFPIWRISQKPADRAFSTLDKARVTVMPNEFSFAVPEEWLNTHLRDEACLAVSPEQIEAVANGTYGKPCFRIR